MRGLRLQHRIVIPFVIVGLVTAAAAAWVALSVTSNALRSRLQAQLVSAAGVMARGDFAVNRGILQTLGEILGAHIITFDDGGRVVASSPVVDRPMLLDVASLAVADAARQQPPYSSVVSSDCGVPCLIAVRPVEGRPGLVLVIVAETSELQAATQAVARAIVLAAAAGLIVMVLVSHSVVRRVTAPLDRLVQFARHVSPQDSKRAEVGNDEVGALALAFNGMLDRLGKSQDALVRSEKLALAGLFAARVAHDIRNPLSSIKMQTQLLRSKLRGDADDDATLTAVLHDVDQVETVIRDLLELARPGELKREPADVNGVVREALQQLAAQFTHRKIVVDARLNDALPLVPLDRERFRGGLLNLLVNASEAMPTGGRVIVESSSDRDSVVLEICDDGVGVDPAMLDRVFDPFVSSKRNGVGLGLVNAKAVVEAHGGRITLQPRQPRGVIVSIQLPVTRRVP